MTDPKIWNPADVRAAIKVAYEFTPYLDLLCKAVADRGRLIAALETLGAVQPEVLKRLADPNSG